MPEGRLSCDLDQAMGPGEDIERNHVSGDIYDRLLAEDSRNKRDSHETAVAVHRKITFHPDLRMKALPPQHQLGKRYDDKMGQESQNNRKEKSPENLWAVFHRDHRVQQNRRRDHHQKDP